jgi:hypothetical protein
VKLSLKEAGMFEDNVYNEVEILKWISERNQHIPIEDLAFMVNIPQDNSLLAEELEMNPLDDFQYN